MGGKNLLEVAKELDRLTGGKFTLYDLMRIIFEREIDGWGGITGIEDIYAEAAGRNYWNWSQDQYGMHTNVTLINWLGGHNSVAGSLYRDVFDNLPAGEKSLDAIVGKTRDYGGNAKAASKAVAALLYTPEEYKIFDANAPYTFGFCKAGGDCMIKEKLRGDFANLPNTKKGGDEKYIFSIDEDEMYYKNGIGYIATFNQAQYWEGK